MAQCKLQKDGFSHVQKFCCLSDTDASLSVGHDNRTSTPAMSVSDDEEFFYIDNMDAEQSDVENNRVVSRISQISDIMEKIKTLQKHRVASRNF